jgi:hypothetical protein
MIRVEIGRIGENIVTNELIARGFLVTHLDKGIRGVATNADLLVGHDKLNEPVLIQVRSCVWPPLDGVFLGGFPPSLLECEGPLFNRKPGFHAHFVAAVSIKSPKEYQVFVIPVSVAEPILKETYRQWHKVPTREGKQRKPVPTMYIHFGLETMRPKDTPAYRIFLPARQMVLDHVDAFNLLLGSRTPPSDVASILEKLAPQVKDVEESE